MKTISICSFLLATVCGYGQDSTALPDNNLAKRRSFQFVTGIPKDLGKTFTLPFRKSNLKTTVAIGAATVLLILSDLFLYEKTRQFSDRIDLDPQESNKILWSIENGSKDIVMLKLPQNLNTAFYMMGQGFVTLFIAGGFAVDGVLGNRRSSLHTASDLSEAFISLGISTQVLKYMNGRENPAVSTQRNGRFQPFPSINDFQNNKPGFDAFPSGHLATLMATITILSDHYPKIKWIKPVGYSLMLLSAFSMINNGVHWAGDYPVGIAIGYLTAKIIRQKNSQIINRAATMKQLL